MSTPSLLNIPYLYKAGTLYSQIPESGAGDFTVSRTTTVANRSTRINKDGLIELVADNVPRLDYPLGGAVNGCPALLVEPSGQNICLQSEAIGVTSWSNTAITVSSNVSATLDPASGNTAEKIVATAVSGNHFTTRAASTQIGQHTFSVFAKAAEYSFIRLQDLNAGKYNVWFDLLSGTANGTGASIQNYGNGWYRCSVTYDGAGASVANGLVGVPTSGGGVSYTGDGTSGIYVWGAQLEVGSVATSYIPTTTAAVTRSSEVIERTGASALIGQSEGTIYWDVLGITATPSTGNPEFGIRNVANSNWISLTSSSPNPFRITCRITTGSLLIDYTANISFAKAAVAWSSAGVVLYVNGVQVATSATNPNFSFDVVRIRGASFTFKAKGIELYPNRLTNAQLQSLTTP